MSNETMSLPHCNISHTQTVLQVAMRMTFDLIAQEIPYARDVLKSVSVPAIDSQQESFAIIFR